MIVWLKFSICSLAMIYAGYKLSLYGNIISEKTQITKTLMGFIFLAVATSLPEFVTSGSSITVVHSPNLAAGDLFGSLLINLMIIALLDLIQGRGPLMYEARPSHILYGGLSIILMAIVCGSIFLRSQLNGSLGVFGFGLDSLVLLAIYILGLRLIFGYEKKTSSVSSSEKESSPLYRGISLRSSLIKFLICFASIVFLGIWLAEIGKELVTAMGWSESLVGTSFLALSTSLPELIVAISALKFSIDMAIGDVLGSNFFDIMIIPFCDALLEGREFLGEISSQHLFTLMLSIILTGIVVVALIYRSRKSFLKLGWDAIAMVATSIVGGYFLILIMKG
ncbi:MAG: sodium:calcium antiporter [bacterium]